jgi:hypothetical protein
MQSREIKVKKEIILSVETSFLKLSRLRLSIETKIKIQTNQDFIA